MDIAKLYTLIGKLTDQQLAQEMSKPSGMAPLYMVMGEMDKRARMRKGTPTQPQSYADGGEVEYDPEAWSPAVQMALAEDPAHPDAVLAVIANRARQAHMTPEQVISARNQFEPYANGRYSKIARSKVLDAMSRPDLQAIMRGNIPESLRGLDHFYSPGGQRALGRGDPSWARGRQGRDIGAQRFYALGYRGGPAGATPPPPPPPNTDVRDPGSVQQRQMLASDEYLKLLGVDRDHPPSLRANWDEASALMPDRTTAPYEELISQLQSQRDQYQRSNRGRPLMEMGLAMMNSRGPNFFNALGAGGQAGLGARDRIQAGQNALMQQVLQGKMAQAQAQAQRDQSLMGTAMPMLNASRGAIAQGLGMGQQTAQEQARIDQTNRELAQRQAETNARMAEAKAARDQAQSNADREFKLQQDRENRLGIQYESPRADWTPEQVDRWAGMTAEAMTEAQLKAMGDRAARQDIGELRAKNYQAALAEYRRRTGKPPARRIATPGNTGTAGDAGGYEVVNVRNQ